MKVEKMSKGSGSGEGFLALIGIVLILIGGIVALIGWGMDPDVHAMIIGGDITALIGLLLILPEAAEFFLD